MNKYIPVKDKNQYRLYILSDGINPMNTRIFIDGKFFGGIQKIDLRMGVENCTYCDMSFIPFNKNKVIKAEARQNESEVSTTFENELEEALNGEILEELIDWDNVLEIATNGVSYDSYFILNGKVIGLVNEFRFCQEVNNPPTIEIKIWEKAGCIGEVPVSVKKQLKDLPGYIAPDKS